MQSEIPTTVLAPGQKVRLLRHWPEGGEGRIYGSRRGKDIFWPILWAGWIGEVLDKKFNHDKCCYEYLVRWPGLELPAGMLQDQIEPVE